MVYRFPKAIARRICARRPAPFAEKIVWMAKRFVQELDNVNFDIDTNGERRLLEALHSISPLCIVDVGANVGDWAVSARQNCPNAIVHALEILPSTYSTLVESTFSDAAIVPHNIGLADVTGTLSIFSSSQPGLNDMATASKISEMRAHDEYYDLETICDVDTGSAFMDRHSIDRIDILKVDTEGYDLKVLKGFGASIRSVRLVQFEYGIFNIASRSLLADFFSFFSQHGFLVGKVYPTYVDFFEYHFSAEGFAGNNYIAVKKEDTEIIKVINGKFRA